MKITVLCSSPEHPVWQALECWIAHQTEQGYEAELVSDVSQLQGGDFLFLVSCTAIVKKEIRDSYRNTLVLHASDLPSGRGWSPYIHEVLAGATRLTITLLEAEDAVDSGRIWLKQTVSLEGYELLPDILDKVTKAELTLMDRAISEFETIVPRDQTADGESYYSRRTPDDSELDPALSLSTQFDLLRVVDNERFPAFFRLNGRKYRLKIEDMGPDED